MSLNCHSIVLYFVLIWFFQVVMPSYLGRLTVPMISIRSILCSSFQLISSPSAFPIMSCLMVVRFHLSLSEVYLRVNICDVSFTYWLFFFVSCLYYTFLVSNYFLIFDRALSLVPEVTHLGVIQRDSCAVPLGWLRGLSLQVFYWRTLKRTGITGAMRTIPSAALNGLLTTAAYHLVIFLRLRI